MDVHSGSIIYFPMTVQFIFREQILQIFALGLGKDLKFKNTFESACMIIPFRATPTFPTSVSTLCGFFFGTKQNKKPSWYELHRTCTVCKAPMMKHKFSGYRKLSLKLVESLPSDRKEEIV